MASAHFSGRGYSEVARQDDAPVEPPAAEESVRAVVAARS
jgi:hypothetical protein